MGAMLSDEGIAQLLAEMVEHLERGDLLQAELVIVQRIDFETLLHPISAEYGVRRVTETGSWIRRCRGAIKDSDSFTALRFAKEAAARWEQQ